MCGINGIITANNDLKKKINKANDLLQHRGPDDEGYVVIECSGSSAERFSGKDSTEAIKHKYPPFNISDDNSKSVILAHRRLSIIDLSENGHCPMCDQSSNIWITFNGEIYNYIELREELIGYGFTFKTHSDTEVIINAYLKWGFECLNKFNGMWAFAIWDKRTKILFMARDRFGVKPLYYVKNDTYFAFSSELKPLTVYNTNCTEINSDKIPFFLIYGNRLNTEETYLKDIFSLPASHYLVYKDGKISISQYYDVKVHSEGLNEEQLKHRIVELLEDSIKLRFRSDVPVGTCLSGGFDSSSIVSLASENHSNSIETFSAVWNEKECDESFYIDIVNNKFGCNANKVIPKEDEFESIFTKLCYYQEIPTEGPGLYPQWYVMAKAKEKVKVLLDGQGGDEVFGGYFQMGAYLRGILRDKSFIKMFGESGSYLKFFNKNGLHSFSSWLFPKQYGYLTRSKFSAKFDIFNRDFIRNIDKESLIYDVEPPKKFGNYLGNLSYHFIVNMTIPTLLHYEDRSSMAHSIESRVPFLDYRLVELGLNLKTSYLSHKGVSRPLYRKALRPFLPDEVVNRKDKLGFPVPFSAWTRGSLKTFIEESLITNGNLLFDYLDKKTLELNLKDHYNGNKDYSWEIWRLLSLKYFINLFTDRKY
ncbi:MAG: asparagine synthase (glutamine-hydrolyzing) [Ignavibacteria bacterium]